MKKIFLLLLLACWLVFGNTAPSYSRTLDLNRIILTIDELKEVVGLIEVYDNDIEKGEPSILEVRISKWNDEISYYSFEQVKTINLDDGNYNEVDISYRPRTDEITQVSIYLWLLQRVRINGSDPKKVNTMYLEMKDFFESKSPFFSSKKWSFVFAVLSMFCFPVLGILILSKKYPNILNKETELSELNIGSYIILLISVLTGFTLFIYFMDYFPDFLLISERKPWYEEYAWILTLLWLLWGIWWIWPKKSK